MSSLLSTTPGPEACGPSYRSYIDRVPFGNVLDALRAEGKETLKVLRSLTDAQWDHSYAEGKWSVKELVSHCVDTERIFSTRALCLARGETASIFGFDQDEYVAVSEANERSGASLVEEWTHLRAANLALFAALSDAAWMRTGQVDGNPMQAISVPWINCGHAIHHMDILRQRYL